MAFGSENSANSSLATEHYAQDKDKFIVVVPITLSEVENMGGRQKTTLLNPVTKEEKKKQQQQQKEQ